jgi:hypothetical protein
MARGFRYAFDITDRIVSADKLRVLAVAAQLIVVKCYCYLDLLRVF